MELKWLDTQVKNRNILSFEGQYKGGLEAGVTDGSVILKPFPLNINFKVFLNSNLPILKKELNCAFKQSSILLLLFNTNHEAYCLVPVWSACSERPRHDRLP